MTFTNRRHARIAELLLKGVKPAEVATLVGVTPGLISQLIRDEEWKSNFEELKRAKEQEVADEATATSEEARERELLSLKYEALERDLIARLQQSAGMGMEDRDAIRLLEILATRKEKALARESALALAKEQGALGRLGAGGVPVVQLMMPSHAAPEFAMELKITTNAQKEIVGIGEQALAPMSAPGVRALFAAKKEEMSANAILEAIPKDQVVQSLPEDF